MINRVRKQKSDSNPLVDVDEDVDVDDDDAAGINVTFTAVVVVDGDVVADELGPMLHWGWKVVDARSKFGETFRKTDRMAATAAAAELNWRTFGCPLMTDRCRCLRQNLGTK